MKFSYFNAIFPICILITSSLSLLNFVQSASFSSIAKMDVLFDIEKQFVTIINQYIQDQVKYIQDLENIIKEYEDEYKKATPDAHRYLSNPLNAYRLMKHLTLDLKKAENLMFQQPNELILQKIASLKKIENFPTGDDFYGTVQSLLRLQNMYKLDISEFVDGFVGNVKYDHKLTAEDCFEFGKESYDSSDYDQAISWMQSALNLLKNEPRSSVSEVKILEYLALSSYESGNISLALDFTNKVLDHNPHNVKVSLKKMSYESQLQKTDEDEEEETVQNSEENFVCGDMEVSDSYQKLCRKEFVMTPDVSKHLKCRYVDHGNPFLKLAPFKEEEAFLDPRIVVYHDVITEEEIGSLKTLAKDEFSDSLLAGGVKSYDIRLSNSAWLTYESHEHVRTVSHRMQHMTGLTNETSEKLQIANYGLGGFFSVHTDYFEDHDKIPMVDNRIATVLFYLSDVEQGGATVFPKLNVTLWPRKGSAAFWHNLRPDGQGDMLTLHGACPVLYGSKWVANKWIHAWGQTFLRPCPVNSNDRYKNLIE